jgi:RNA-directed DNA polymerase
VDLPAGLVAESAIRSALDVELDKPPPLLPASPVSPALLSRRDEVAAWVLGQVSGVFNPAPQEIVAVSKSRHGIRPVAMWDLPSRLVYRALTGILTEGREFPERSSDAWKDFQRSPLVSRRRGGYVVEADIASCYELIDHALLGQELLIQTGNHQVVDALMKVLRETSGRTYGLPQQCSASDLLAEIFLDKLERALLRRGLAITRYNDDFRLRCNTWSEVIWAIETLTDETRNHGLILNDSKLIPWSRSNYKESLDEADELREQITRDAELEAASFVFEGYDGQFDFPEEDADETQAIAALRILQRWDDIVVDGRVGDDDRAVHRALLQLLPYAFSVLSSFSGDLDDSIAIAMQMLRYEQTMTPHIGRFLMTRENDSEILSEFDSLHKKNAYLTGWQTWWLQQPLARIPSFMTGDESKARREWTRGAFNSAERSPVLRAQAAMTLARHNAIGEDELLRVYDRSSPVTRPVVAAAVALCKPSARVSRAVTGDSQLNRWVFDWARVNA